MSIIAEIIVWTFFVIFLLNLMGVSIFMYIPFSAIMYMITALVLIEHLSKLGSSVAA
jgi:hypothetical protein